MKVTDLSVVCNVAEAEIVKLDSVVLRQEDVRRILERLKDTF